MSGCFNALQSTEGGLYLVWQGGVWAIAAKRARQLCKVEEQSS